MSVPNLQQKLSFTTVPADVIQWHLWVITLVSGLGRTSLHVRRKFKALLPVAMCLNTAATDVRGCTLLDHLVGAGKQERWHIKTIALAALSFVHTLLATDSCSRPPGHRLHQQRERCA